MKTKQKKKRKLNWIKLLILVLFLYIFAYGIYTLFKMPIHNIIINGNSLVTDAEIIEHAGMKNYPGFLTLRIKKIKTNILKIPLIKKVEIKRKLNFKVIINVEESKIVFLNSDTSKLMLDSGEYMENSNKYLSIPTLVNYAPDEILKKFAQGFKDVDQSIINDISEIIYDRLVNEEGNLIDDTRFKLMMNEGNTVYTNVEKVPILNYYQQIYASLENPKGIYYLDSGNYKNFLFTPYEG